MYIVKGVSGPEMVAVARKVLAGERYIDPDLARALALALDPESRPSVSSLLNELSTNSV